MADPVTDVSDPSSFGRIYDVVQGPRNIMLSLRLGFERGACEQLLLVTLSPAAQCAGPGWFCCALSLSLIPE